jgi:hypothetical protein
MKLCGLCKPRGTGFARASTMLAYLDLETFIILRVRFVILYSVHATFRDQDKYLPYRFVNSGEVGSYSDEKGF